MTMTKTLKPNVKMTPLERQTWLIEHIRTKQCESGCMQYFNVLDAAFSDAYITATGVPFQPTPFGAFRCRTLGSDLSALHKCGQLQRHAAGLPTGSNNEGFPKWVYLYSL